MLRSKYAREYDYIDNNCWEREREGGREREHASIWKETSFASQKRHI
jgi:hypothetical protein